MNRNSEAINFKLIKIQEIMICLSVSLLLVYNHIISLFNGFIRQFIVLPFKFDTLFIYTVFLLIILLSIKTIINRSSPFIFSIIALLFGGYLITIIIFSYNYFDYYVKLGIDFLVFSVPCIFVTYAVRDYKLLKKYIIISAYITMISVIMNIFVFKIDVFGGHSYDQSYSYALLSVAVIAGSFLFKRIRLTNLVFFALSTILMLSMGARGPLFSLLLFMLLKLLLLFKEKPRSMIFICLMILLVILAQCFLHYDYLVLLDHLFKYFNLSTRVIAQILEGAFFQDDARSLLLKYSIDLISKYPIIGVGIGNDRILIANKFGITNISKAMGWYPHNIFLELLLHFGLFMGSVAIIILIKLFYATVFKNKNKDAVDVICIFLGIGLFPLFVSGSYITNFKFFALLGFCLYQYSNNRVVNKNYQTQNLEAVYYEKD